MSDRDVNSIENTIRKNLITLRTKHNYTRKFVAEAIDVLPNSYRVWEVENKSGIKTANLVKLADFYGLSVDYFTVDHKFDELEVASDSGYTDNFALSEQEKELILKLRSMSDEKREEITNNILE